MKILWVKSGGLLPMDHGGRIRSFHLAKELATHHDVSLFTFASEAEDPIAAHEPLNKIFQQVICLPLKIPPARGWRETMNYVQNLPSTRPYSMSKYCQPWIARELRDLLAQKEYDLLLCDFLLTAAVVPWDWPKPKVLFTHNIEAVIWERHYRLSRNPIWKAVSYREYRLLERMEREYVSRAEHVLAVSENDRDFFLKYAPESRMSVIPTGVDVDYFSPRDGEEDPSSIVFTGSMDWTANEDGIVFFIENVLPLVRRRFPRAKLWVVGRRPTSRLQQIGRSITDVEVTGTVDDIRPYLSRGSVYVVPLRVGGGTRIKIFEAMAAGKAVVSTTIGAEGLPVQDGENILLADDAETFAKCVVDLLSDEVRRKNLGAAARKLVSENYSWKAVGKTMAKVLEAVATEHAPAVREDVIS
ncbi:MAG TPA: glycosyltransferase [Terriglobales bacterium]|nr:glycosyltransferase [Terriglobales bacterium]